MTTSVGLFSSSLTIVSFESGHASSTRREATTCFQTVSLIDRESAFHPSIETKLALPEPDVCGVVLGFEFLTGKKTNNQKNVFLEPPDFCF